MDRILFPVASVFAVALVFPLSCYGQGGQPGSQVETQSQSSSQVYVVGEISGGDSLLINWTVELIPFSGGPRIGTTLRPDGSFSLPTVAAGAYEVRVIDVNGRVVHDETISLRRSSVRLSITVPSSEAGSQMRPGSISVQQLQHKVPSKARAEFNKGENALKKRQANQAIEHLKAAVSIDPAFADAHNDLGIAYLGLKQYAASAEQFQKALALDRNYQPANDNLCLVLLKMQRYAEAAQLADSVLRRGDPSAMAHYTAAVGQIVAGGKRTEALDHLRRAQDDLPAARLLSAQLLAEAGLRTDAAQELKAYLRSPEAEARRAELEAWLAELTR